MDAGTDRSDGEAGSPAQPRRRRRRTLAIGVGGVALIVGIIWSERGDIAEHELGALLREEGIPAKYRIASLELGQQVVTDVVVGDPAAPDLTVDRVITSAGLHGGAPGLDSVTLINPRLRGHLRGGKLSFGSLDKLIYGPSSGPFRMPAMVLRVENGRGEIVGDAGAIGLGLNGGGALRDGFGGALVAVARHLAVAGCAASEVKLAGRVGISGERLRLAGPLQLAGLKCAGVQSGAVTLPLDVRATQALDGADGHVGLAGKELAFGGARADGLHGGSDVTLRGSAITARFNGIVQGLRGGHVVAASLGGEGLLRTDLGSGHIAAEGTLNGAGLTPDAAAWQAFARARQAGAETPAGPLLARIGQVLAREAPGSRLAGRFILHRSGNSSSLFLPEARLSGGSGAALLDVSRAAVVSGAAGLQVSGRFTTGGALPQIAGAMARGNDGRDRLNVTMANYRAGAAALAVPRLNLALAGGHLALAGEAVMSGPLPGGATQNLHLPLAGSWTKQGFNLWPGCAQVSFDRLALASLTLLRDGLTVCPRPGGAIVQIGVRGTSIAAGIASFDLAGQLAGSPIRLTGGPLGLALPSKAADTVVAKSVAVVLGEGQGASHFRIDDVNAGLGATIAGSFSGSDVDLAAVPLNLRALAGDWQYQRGTLNIFNAGFRVEDRETTPRFQPLVARGGVLTLADGAITALAVLREPKSDREVTRVAIQHDLGSGDGHANLGVAGIRFDKDLQPEALSTLVLGIVADVRGTVAGQGTIDWAGGNVTSRGRFATDSLDLAAAFGPVTGIAGSITFTDLLGLVSAPEQKLKIATINPGVEVDDGVLTYALLPGHILAIDGATWPFLDGRLRLLPTRMTLGASEVRRYEMRVEGVDAAKFLVRMNMSNLSATGVFDGGLPLVFDQNGGSVVGGMLASRPPGGSVSYIGSLSYKDLSPIANYAFETLKSLEYKQLTIGLDGSISGNIFTRVSMKGVSQGPGAKRNFITRQIAKLPLQFNVNIHAPFYMLLTNFKSLYDSSYLPDPRALGLLGADGKPILNPKPAAAPPKTDVQPSVSETKP